MEQEFKTDFGCSATPVKWPLFCFIQNIKVDIVKYAHPLIAAMEERGDIRTYSTPDIAAMKLNAILGRGVKKDFWDVYKLLQHYSLHELIGFHHAKFPTQLLLISIPDFGAP